LKANCNLLKLNNEELALEYKKSQLNITISNASVSNNVNAGEKPTQKTSTTNLMEIGI